MHRSLFHTKLVAAICKDKPKAAAVTCETRQMNGNVVDSFRVDYGANGSVH